MSQFSTLHINWVDSFILYDIMKVKLMICDCPRVMNTDNSKLINIYKTLYVCKYHSYRNLLFCKTWEMCHIFWIGCFTPKKYNHVV